jgi:hypothetical protein
MVNELKNRDQHNKINNLEKSGKIEFYVSISKTLYDLNTLKVNKTGRTLK